MENSYLLICTVVQMELNISLYRSLKNRNLKPSFTISEF